VVDFTRVLAGPHMTKILCDLGATVIKIEDPKNGDISRLGSPKTGHHSHYFAQQNAGKYFISIDLNKDRGREVVRKLLREADVLVENNDDLPQFQHQIRMWLDTLIQAS